MVVVVVELMALILTILPTMPRLLVPGRRAEATSIMRAAMNIAVPTTGQQQHGTPARRRQGRAAAGGGGVGDELGITVTATATASRAMAHPNPHVASPPVGDLLLDDKAAPKNSPAEDLVMPAWAAPSAYNSGGSSSISGISGEAQTGGEPNVGWGAQGVRHGAPLVCSKILG